MHSERSLMTEFPSSVKQCSDLRHCLHSQESSQGIERVHITQLLKPLRLALDTALAKHDREVDLKRAHDRATSGSIAIETA